MTARIGVGSAVTVEVGVSVGASVALVRVGLGVCEGVLVVAPKIAVDWFGFGD